MHRFLNAIKEFVLSSSGQVSPANGMAKGVLLAGLAIAAAAIGTATRANAEDCYGIPDYQTRFVCSTLCETCEEVKYVQHEYYHDPSSCYPTGQTKCVNACC